MSGRKKKMAVMGLLQVSPAAQTAPRRDGRRILRLLLKTIKAH